MVDTGHMGLFSTFLQILLSIMMLNLLQYLDAVYNCKPDLFMFQ